jgi:hypothetical protein
MAGAVQTPFLTAPELIVSDPIHSHRGNGFDLKQQDRMQGKKKPAFNKRAGKVFALDYGRLMGDPYCFYMSDQ